MSTPHIHRVHAHRWTQPAATSGPWGQRIRIAGGILVLAAVGVVAATAIARSGGGTEKATLPAGTRIIGGLDHTITTEHGRVGQTFEIRTAEPMTLSAGAVIPAGVVVRGEVTHTKGGGRVAGAPELTLRFTRLTVDGRDYAIVAEPFRLRGKNDALESAAEIGGGTVVGGVIGAVTGSTLKGAVIGGILGTGVAVATKGDQLVLPAGQKIRIELAEPVTIRYAREDAEK